MVISCLSMTAQDKIRLNNLVNRSGWCPRSPVEAKTYYLPPKKWEQHSFFWFFNKGRGCAQAGQTDGRTKHNPCLFLMKWHMLLLWYSLTFITLPATSMKSSSVVEVVPCSRKERSILSHSHSPEADKVLTLKSSFHYVRLRYIPCISLIPFNYLSLL